MIESELLEADSLEETRMTIHQIREISNKNRENEDAPAVDSEVVLKVAEIWYSSIIKGIENEASQGKNIYVNKKNILNLDKTGHAVLYQLKRLLKEEGYDVALGYEVSEYYDTCFRTLSVGW